ncbi:sensor histidine kinase [Sphingomicrobium nitratireducens]|uniref:sensor histidine kinase n=1 Tax=Sphingomicrobium nitratireducens TaxID=2964666 RepID=UPI0022400375|nr:histidine kinase dimerization/phosphoacceptor domain -containing protein [Sphingomicrobium nitratireducens]
MTSDPKPHRFASLSTPLALFLAILLALLPIGGLLLYSTYQEVRESEETARGEAAGMMLVGARAAEALIARNTLALRVAANGALEAGADDPCESARRTLDVAPALSRDFSITGENGLAICGNERLLGPEAGDPVRAGDVKLWVDEDSEGILMRVAVAGGTATSAISAMELADAIEDVAPDLVDFTIDDGERQLDLFPDKRSATGTDARLTLELAGGRLKAIAAVSYVDERGVDGLLLLLPVLMWILAALIAWAMVHWLLSRPLRHLRQAVVDYDPDEGHFELPDRLGPASEIRDLGEAFVETVERIEHSEKQLHGALEGQRKLVREVHHRVKNNLQVVASLLNIHSRTAEGEEAQAAYAGIGRRVEALAVVHRNHFAEVEESRGIQLRPLVTELAASLRASAPGGRASPIQVELDSAATTQDTAVAAAFLITEIVEYAMYRDTGAPIDISLRRTSELTARLSVSGEALIVDKDRAALPEHVQFERILDGLARQLRSILDRKVGSYAVELPIFPEN